ncbi:hypothetical protein NKI38_32905 [Mesorhizobium sp. M0621]|uniref:hypothetical protein n=1 Tax=Mesorhizobium sp. M0621 TaxID=2956974 RepID=UPI003334C2CB
MHTLPANIDADVVLAIGWMLDDHAKLASVSLADSVEQIRGSQTTSLTDIEIEELVIEMAGSRGLAVLLDRTAR